MGGTKGNCGIIVSADGSPTLFSERFGESYRSSGGATEESMHVFVNGGLFRYTSGTVRTGNINILEYGFGTGMNALSTITAAPGTKINYTSLDLFPLGTGECMKLLPPDAGHDTRNLFLAIHKAGWGISGKSVFTPVTENFSIRKILCDFRTFEPAGANEERQWIDVIYFDPFSPSSEPECWKEDIFARIRLSSKPGAVLSTYSAKGEVKRALRSAGWEVTRVPGSGTKRHNLIAVNRL